MVRPGMINLDFADVETIMSSMGKAMMGTGEAEGENRATVATEIALNNPLIDEYSLKGAKGLLINITGGKDLTLFEVDQTVQKVRAEVDPEAELIFGAIKDTSMEGKMRVSIVATALDGLKKGTNTVLNMVSRIQDRNHSHSDGLFSHHTNMENNTLSSIDGATALKLDEKFEVNEVHNEAVVNNFEQSYLKQENELANDETDSENIPMGVSIENTSYIESNKSTPPNESLISNSEPQSVEVEEHTPQLFSDENDNNLEEFSDPGSEKLFDQDFNEEEDFEIPAFLRKQKF